MTIFNEAAKIEGFHSYGTEVVKGQSRYLHIIASMQKWAFLQISGSACIDDSWWQQCTLKKNYNHFLQVDLYKYYNIHFHERV